MAGLGWAALETAVRATAVQGLEGPVREVLAKGGQEGQARVEQVGQVTVAQGWAAQGWAMVAQGWAEQATAAQG